MKLYYSILFSFILFYAVGQQMEDFKMRGFIDTYHAFRIRDQHDFLASRSRFRGEIQMVKDNSHFFASINALHNNVLPEQTGIQFREAYFEFTQEKWGIKVGRQLIIWGKADGLKITDVISPMDLTEFLAQDYDDIRMPVNSIVFSKVSNNWDLVLVLVPLFEGYILPGPNNPWGTDFSELGLVEDKAKTPEYNLSNMEYGAKLSSYFSGIDIEVSALNTWNKAPVYRYYINDSTGLMHIKPEHHRLGFAGLGFSKSVYSFILRGESAFYFDKKFTPKPEQYEAGLLESNSINYLLGVDWYPGNEWTLTGQISDEYILDYSSENLRDKHTYVSTLGITKKILYGTLTLSTFGYYGLNEGGFSIRAHADYALSDNVHAMVGCDLFHGDGGAFGRYKENSQVWLKAKYSF